MPDFSIGIGTVISIGRGATPIWTPLVGVKDVTLPEAAADKIDITNMGSPRYTKQYIRGLRDNGDVSFEVIWDPGSATDILLSSLDESDGEIVQIRFAIAGVSTPFIYRGFLSTYKRTAPVGDVMMSEVTFSISERVTV